MELFPAVPEVAVSITGTIPFFPENPPQKWPPGHFLLFCSAWFHKKLDVSLNLMEAVKSFKWMTVICPHQCGLMVVSTNSPHPATGDGGTGGGGHVPHWVPAASESRLLKAALLHYTRFQLWEVAKWFPKSPLIFFFFGRLWGFTINKKYIAEFWGRLQTQRDTHINLVRNSICEVQFQSPLLAAGFHG